MSLTAGVISLVSKSSSEVKLSATAASGGTSPYTQQWYKSTTTGFSPGAGNLISGATALTLDDLLVVPNTTYYYKVVYTDVGNSNATVTSTQLAVAVPVLVPAINAFTQAPFLGMLDLRFNPNSVAVQIDSTESGTLYGGQAVKVVDSADGIPKVIACAANTDECFGFINYDIKSQKFVAGDRCEISQAQNVIYLYAATAIARGAQVTLNVGAPGSVNAAVSGDKIVGWAFDKAAAQGALIRVRLSVPSFTLAS